MHAHAQTTVLSENFDNGFPVDWQRIDGDGKTPNAAVSQFIFAWIPGNDADSSSTDSTVMSTSYYTPAGTSHDYLITPRLQLGAFGNYLYWEARSQDASFPDGYQVLVSVTDSLPGSFTDTIHISPGETPFWSTYSLSLDTAGYTSQSVFLAFENNSFDKFILHLDNITVVAEDPVGVNEQHIDNVMVYPQPAVQELHIQGKSEEYALYGVHGQLITTLKQGHNSLPEMAPGIYVLRWQQNGIPGMRKIILSQ